MIMIMIHHHRPSPPPPLFDWNQRGWQKVPSIKALSYLSSDNTSAAPCVDIQLYGHRYTCRKVSLYFAKKLKKEQKACLPIRPIHDIKLTLWGG